MERTKYYFGIKRYIVSRIQNPDDAEDLAQSVFLEFYRSNNSNYAENPEPYLFGIARNLIAGYYRQKDQQPEILQLNTQIADKADFNSYSKNSKTRYWVEEIEAIVLELPPKAREAVKLRLIDGLSSQEAASHMDCTMDRFYDRLYEGLKIIKNNCNPNQLKTKELYKKSKKS